MQRDSQENAHAYRIRPAVADEAPAMVALSEQKRTQYAAFQPVFWRKAANAAEVQTAHFRRLLNQDNVLALVAAQEDKPSAPLLGFVIATLIPAPPVYDPGGLTCVIDDFCVADEGAWQTVGRVLLDAVTEQAVTRGAVQVVVVCGHLDEPKRAMLREAGLRIASEWYVKPIA
ncbi:MAG TPA: hypothetical protein VNK95_20140 [Caldilineaceae bacterium]|nr:hypothetical protein [Caldilineaceae bacterium]